MGDRESTRFINKELSDLWKVATPDGDSISGRFTPEELANALNHVKPGKPPGLNYIFLAFTLRSRSAHKS